jgi:signal transduction histidine kinase/CheY-like chemotaxis protein
MPFRDSPRTPTPRAYADLRRRVLTVSVTLSLVVVTIAIVGLAELRRNAIDDARHRAASYSHLLAAHMDRVVSAVKARLREIASQSHHLGGPEGRREQWNYVLNAAHSGSSAIAAISILDLEGRIRHSSLREIVGLPISDIVGQERFAATWGRVRGESGGDVVVGAPLVSPSFGRLVLPFSARLPAANDEVEGVVSAAFDPEAFRNFYREVQIKGGTLRILHASGATFLREPADGAERVLQNDPVLNAYREGRRQGEIIGPLVDGGPELITSYDNVEGADLIVVVTLDQNIVLGPWQRFALSASFMLVCVLAAFWVAVVLMLRQLAARETVESELLKQQQETAERQRLESLGQLTGGVAHDFNNLLTVIMNAADSALLRAPKEVRPMLEAVLAAAENGASLVRQLLAFARRQSLKFEPLDLNEAVSQVEDVLRRTLGSLIDIQLAQGRDLWPAYADRAQVESALLNLAINARDAMPDGGKLTIETQNVVLDEAYAEANAEVAPGEYVMLAVSDTGAGMAPEILDRALEPFFTTKQVGRGSGLGLSMIYGFAKQSKGHLKIYSEVGRGTTVRLYLPRAIGDDGVQRLSESGVARDGPGTETILIAEDEPQVRALAVASLQERGYNVIDAANAAEALAVLEGDIPIHLLLTDIVMPGSMTGKELAEEALKRRPGIKVLFTSGYADASVMRNGLVSAGAKFLSKPYRSSQLAAEVRALLDEPQPSAPPAELP